MKVVVFKMPELLGRIIRAVFGMKSEKQDM